MGPEDRSETGRPRFQWDVKNAPWSDGVGDQYEYVRSVRSRSVCMDALGTNRSNRVPKKLRRLLLQAQLRWRGKELTSHLSPEELVTGNGVEVIIDSLHNPDPHMVINKVYEAFNNLVNCKRSPNESLD